MDRSLWACSTCQGTIRRVLSTDAPGLPGVTAPGGPGPGAAARSLAIPVLTFVIIHSLPIETIDVSVRNVRFDSAVIGRSPAHERGVFVVRTQLLRLILMTCLASWSWAANFGKVIQIGGHASDLALDERRGLLYVANFTANRIEVISTSDYARQSPYRVPPQPGSIALSPDGRYLVIAHYARWTDPAEFEPAVTILDLDTAGQRTLSHDLLTAGGGLWRREPGASGVRNRIPAVGPGHGRVPGTQAYRHGRHGLAGSLRHLPAPDRPSFGGCLW